LAFENKFRGAALKVPLEDKHALLDHFRFVIFANGGAKEASFPSERKQKSFGHCSLLSSVGFADV